MRLCCPIDEDRGLDSPVCAHFGGAPLFLVLDTESGVCEALPNRNLDHQHGACQPLLSLEGAAIDAVAVGGIGRGALTKLMAAGLKVYRATKPTVRELLEEHRAGALQLVGLDQACSHHGHGGGCHG